MRATDLLQRLHVLPPDARDAALERILGIDGPTSSAPPGAEMIGYHASGVAPIVRALHEAAVAADDVVVDLGAGLGKVVVLARVLTGAAARGVEIQPELAARAREAASARGFDVTFECGDVRDADLDDGTVFFLYLPFVDSVLDLVLARLLRVAERRAIVVCALGTELRVPWLVPRGIDAFWLEIYDSRSEGVAPRPARPSSLTPAAEDIAFERDAPLAIRS